MSSIKRKAPTGAGLGGLLQRRVKARIEPESESDIEQDESDEAPSEEDVRSDEGSGSEEDEEDTSGSEEDSDAESDGSSVFDARARKSAADAAAQLSFGALVRAQASLDKPGKKGKKRRGSNEDADPSNEDEDAPDNQRKSFRDEFKDNLKKKREVHKRSSKHAPVEMSSKKPVSRKRDFVEVPKVKARDPRFGPLGPGHGYSAPIDEAKLRKAYSFLDEYQEAEMGQLREAIKKTKDPQEKEKLSRALMSMESKKKARERKDRERQLLEEHRKQEKELVKEGKQPFYLKKSEQKKRLLVDQFAHMKKSQVDKAIEKKRKKVAGREKKALPYGRRTAEDRH